MNALLALVFGLLCCACGYGVTEAAIRQYRDFRWAWIRARTGGYIPKEPGEPDKDPVHDYRGYAPWEMLFVRTALVILPLFVLAVGFGAWALKLWNGD